MTGMEQILLSDWTIPSMFRGHDPCVIELYENCLLFTAGSLIMQQVSGLGLFTNHTDN